MYQKHPDFESDGQIKIEGFNLASKADDAAQYEEMLRSIDSSVGGAFVPLLLNQLRSHSDKTLFVVTVCERFSGFLPELTGWVLFRYTGDLEVKSCGLIANTEDAYWAINKKMEQYTGTPLTTRVDQSVPIEPPPSLDFRC